MIIIWLVVFVAAAYLLGAIPTAYLFARYLTKVDITRYGSGNVGATNALRLLGKLPGALVLFLDLAKGMVTVTLIAGFALRLLSNIELTILKSILGVAVVIGHNWSVYLKFKGGKGVAASAGVLAGLDPFLLLIAVLVFMCMLILTKFVSLASITAAVSIPVFMVIFAQPAEFIIASVILCMLIVFRHQGNIKRLLRGDERKIFSKW
ncbi:MAG: glycerol-3-phosphate 1-O-acyltransferase PlsY [Candidatus Omnitrophota bacterium]